MAKAEVLTKDERLQQAIKEIEREYGKGSVMMLGSCERVSVDAIPTGCLSLDVALGIGGLPKGRIIEIYGPESAGKSTLALSVIAEAQKNGGTCAYIDAENSIDPVYAENMGVDIDNLLLSQPDSGEQGLDIAETLIKSGIVDLIVIDSVAALVPQAELDGEMGASSVGLQARLMSKAMRKLAGAMNKTGTTVIFINQLREKVGILFGNPETTPGGKALKFYASVRLDVRKGEAIKDGSNQIGNKVKIKVVKNKVAPPFKTGEGFMIYGQGFSKVDELLSMAIEAGIVEKAGSWLSYNGEKLGQGYANARKYALEHPEFMAEIESQIRGALFPPETDENGEVV